MSLNCAQWPWKPPASPHQLTIPLGLFPVADLLLPPINRADDLIPEESETVQSALSRLDAKERYDRIFRIRRAVQCSISHKLLAKNEWTKPEEDVPYLLPLIKVIEAEGSEKEALDTMTVYKKH